MTNLVKKLVADYPLVNIVESDRFMWSPSTTTVKFDAGIIDSPNGRLALMHELAHGLLKHNSYRSDLQLLTFEVSAWTKARQLAVYYDLEVDESYIDDCIESYREWLYKRSTCVVCGTNSLQDDKGIYHCHICSASWKVPKSQLCRVQRRTVKK